MKIKLLIIIILFPFVVFSQLRGSNSYMFLNLETSPRVAAMGGNLIAVYDNDLSLTRTTPSLLNASMNNQLVFSFTDYLSDINIISFSYAREFNMIGVLSLDFKSIDYGSFELNNEFGENMGNFSATDQIITLGIGRILNRSFSIGANLSLLNSNYESYNSLALSSNIATTYINMNKKMASTLILKNIGKQLNTYSNSEDLPFEMQFAISKVLLHLPFRYHVSYNYINSFNIKSPYKLIQQTNFETGNTQSVMDGDLNNFIRAFLLSSINSRINK